MDIAALLMWVVTALGGFSMLGVWIKRGGPQGGSSSRLPVPVVFGHFGLAAAGLVVWIVYVITDKDALAWTAFGLLVPVALLGFTMLARWIPVYQARATTPAADPQGRGAPAERYFPVPVVAGHGLSAVTTVVLVLLTALGIGGS
ncbi:MULTISPECIES: hypothetical protein [unclassified Streptomyces]|uniref:hypothetical protein n=1 Tax=unclassified Streptomyces TaxID=2593676 RepID=UPI002E34E34A|nr:MULTISPECIES: hypothetical protein [unclassified Streptomyces]WUC68252.1 hypothetical protein OG861_30620 [Streptomyces sp. NBC_00539]